MLGILFAVFCTWAFALKLIVDRTFYTNCRQQYILFSTIIDILWRRWITKPISVHQTTSRVKITFHDGTQYCHIFLKKCVPIITIKGAKSKEDYTLELKSYFKWEQDYPSPRILSLDEDLEVKYKDDTIYAVQNEY
ncbi:hypothetical protein LDVICp145 [lymphocystis disease virus-China]|uniref:Uncharacterized protein n=2 Tax=Lymphocystis disease virus 2 TaxID=159183 RepID=A0A6F8X2K7_9VIRU|nr:hypothetical protein LDVICp145 [lymphocystis disease virus-China]AAU10990.1 hypothetical protein [lymphocystis disease virus-China]BCB67496.1 hypothetical protein [Lymphocystis disease virus 2]